MSSTHGPCQNHLLAALPAAHLDDIAADLELVPMALGDMLGEPGRAFRHVYFPTTAVVSLYHLTSTGAMAESACVGQEGVIGIALFMGGDSMPSSAVVRSGGHGYRLARAPLMQGFARSGPLRNALLRYTQGLITQIGQNAVCYRHHTVDQQLSRWVLATADRAPGSDLVMTHEMLASLLGVRRESVTSAAVKLRDGGYIR